MNIRVGVGVMIFNENKVLIAKRSEKAQNEKGKWEFPGGGVEFGETLQEALKREVFEELGIEIKNIELLGVADHILPEESQHWVSPSFRADYASGEITNKEPDKMKEWKWVDISEIDQYELSKASASTYNDYGKKY